MDTSTRIMDAARETLLAVGFAKLSTRGVAERAGVPLSQIHYHFAGKRGLVLALLAHENRTLVDRQQAMYLASAPLSERYAQACDFLDDDLASGYVRVLQEMIAAGWSDAELAARVVELLHAWFDILEHVAVEAEQRLGSLGVIGPADVARLVGLAFLGAESMILLGDDAFTDRVRSSLRCVGALISSAERAAPTRQPGG